MSERERFESWARNNTGMPCISCRVTGEYYSITTQIAWLSWQAACPDGWQCVPKELDEAMSEAFEESFADQGWHPDIGGEIDKQDIWDAQLDAAPKPGDV